MKKIIEQIRPLMALVTLPSGALYAAEDNNISMVEEEFDCGNVAKEVLSKSDSAQLAVICRAGESRNRFLFLRLMSILFQIVGTKTCTS